MKKPLFNQEKYLDAFIKTAQYLASLTSQQDAWSEIGKVMTSFFGADLAGFAERRTDGEITGHHWILPDKVPSESILTIETKRIVAEVLESGFLATHQINTPEEYSLAILPVSQKHQTIGVMLTGYRMSEPLPKDLLNVYLAVAGLAGTTIAKLAGDEALRESEEKCRSIGDSAQDAIIILDNEGNISLWNEAAERMFGYTREEALGRGLHRLLVPRRYYDAYKKGFSRFRKTGKGSAVGKTLEYSAIRKNGLEFPIELSLSSVKLEGKWNAIGIVRDITERKRAEEEKLALERQVLHAQKLESLGLLAGGIAHDFNNLLMSILGNADLALHELSPMSPARRNLQEIEKVSRRAAELAKQMLAYSGKGQFVIEPIKAGELVEEMTHLLEVSISKKALLKYNFAENLLTFDGDVMQIRQIIMNLITNASEAIGDRSGVIALSTGAMDCDRAYLDGVNEVLRAVLDEPLPEGLYIYLEVADTGCGMDAKTIDKIFDPFFSTKFTGRGLGMSVVLGIVRGHKGAIKIHSEVGKGTTFRILFPVSELPGNGIAKRKKDESEGDDWCGGGTVLLIDDEEMIRAVCKRMLKVMGFSVVMAQDGREALKVFGEHADEIVCVLLDLTMPHMDGEEAFREMQRLDPGVKVILCSGYNEQEATQRFAGKGLAGFLQKPYSMAELRQKLMDVLPADEGEQ